MARLDPDILSQAERLADRVLDVVEALSGTPCSRRIVDQLAASGTSIGANVFEADEAMSRPDFVRCLAIAVKEANETRFWLRLIARRAWLAPDRLTSLEQDVNSFKRILGAMIARTKKPARTPAAPL